MGPTTWSLQASLRGPTWHSRCRPIPNALAAVSRYCGSGRELVNSAQVLRSVGRPMLPQAAFSRAMKRKQNLREAAELLTDGAHPNPCRRELVEPHATWCYLPHIAATPGQAPDSQLLEVLHHMESELALAGLAFTDVIRTWFAVDRILDWYDSFNRVRNDFFRDRGLLGGPIPASTAVGGQSATGSAVSASAIAVRPHDASLTRRPLQSPRQCEATHYASAFSRAFAVDWPGSYRVYVSGTAAIDEHGRSMHRGDTRAQVQTTLDVIEDLLRSVDLTFAHALDAKAYFRRRQDAPLIDLVHQRGVAVPVSCARAEICRDELLFELELTAGWGPGARVEGVV